MCAQSSELCLPPRSNGGPELRTREGATSRVEMAGEGSIDVKSRVEPSILEAISSCLLSFVKSRVSRLWVNL